MPAVVPGGSPVGVALVGAGFLAATRARCYGRSAVARVVAVVDLEEEVARNFARRHDVPFATTDPDEVLCRPDVGLVDLCVPNHVHRSEAERAVAAGRHVVCTKPLTAYVGQDLAAGTDDAAIAGTDPRHMLRVARGDARSMVQAAREAGVRLMYGENWIFAPSLVRARGLLGATPGPILEMRGWESHSGSHSPFARRWGANGGGALIRLAAHPLGAMIHLKAEEGRRRDGRPIVPVAVTAEVADLSAVEGLDPERSFVATGWGHVENWGCVVIAFSDGARGIAYGSDNMLGGMESRLEILTADAHLKCNLSPSNLLRAYSPRPEGFGDEYVMEKTDTSTGWSTPMPDEDWTSGHQAMCDAFARAAAENRDPPSTGELGAEVVRVIYAAYVSAREGGRIALDSLD